MEYEEYEDEVGPCEEAWGDISDMMYGGDERDAHGNPEWLVWGD